MEELQRKTFDALKNGEFYDANNNMLLLCSMVLDYSNTQSKEAYISLFFTEGASVITYIKTISEGNQIITHKSVGKCLEVIHVLLNNFPKEMADHISSIVYVCHLLIGDKKFSRLKPKCANILLLLLTSVEIDLDESLLLDIYNRVKLYLNDKATTSRTVYIQAIAALSGKRQMGAENEEIANIIINFMRTTTGSQILLQGGYQAAHEFMKHMEFSSEQQLLLYEYMKRDVKLNSDNSNKYNNQRHGSRTAVKFTAQAADLFGMQMANDLDEWSTSLNEWLHATSRDNSTAGYEALLAVHRAVGNVWAQTEERHPNFIPLLDKSKAILEEDNNSDEAKTAICTLGYLAPAAAKFLSGTDFRDLFLFLLQRIEYLIFVKTAANSNVVVATSCDYVEAISPFLAHLSSDVELHINQFKRVTIILIRMFPNILVTKHALVVKTLLSMFASISRSSNTFFRDFVEDVVKQGVIWTCSHNLAQRIEILDSDEVSYKRYLPLWRGLLDTEGRDELNEIQKALWDSLIKNCIYLSHKLNLKVTFQEFPTAEGTCDQLQAEKTNDFDVFANLTDFYCDLLGGANAACLKPWLDTLCDKMIRKSTQLPLVSGFYKILATVMKLFERVDYFHQTRLHRENVRVTFENIKSHMKLVRTKLHRFKNDLQLSCVRLILCMPIAIVKAIHFDFADLFIIAFKLGQHNFPIANDALETLSKWFTELSEDVTHPLLRKIVPCLDAYLRNQFVVGDSYHVQGRKLKKYSQRKLDVEVEPELLKLQHDVLRFLAVLPNEICLELSAVSSEVKLTTGEANLLKVNLPFGERSLALWLDPFLERVLVLSLECTDRKVRITACEFLHSIVAVFLGMSVQISPASGLDPHLKKIARALMQLASDQDATVMSLFHPLLLQLAHWYSQPKHMGTSHSHIFITSLLRGVSNDNDAAVRDLSGVVLREFVAWTRKQTTKTSLKDQLNNIKLIIEHLKQFSLHPDEAKRYGATVIFNNIYKELREEDTMVDAFWLEILYAFVMNLSLVPPAANDDDDLLLQINLCLDRVTRCLLHKQAIFERNTSRERRCTPPNFNGNTFDDAAYFILQYTCHINTHCRAKCMEIFKTLPTETINKALESFRPHVGRSYMHDLDTTPFFSDVKSIEGVLRYFASLTCFIDGYIFIPKLSPHHDQGHTVLWSMLNKLINAEFKTKTLEKIQETLGIQNGALVRRIKDEFAFFREKLVEKVLELYSNADLVVVNEHSWSFLIDYLFDYHALGLTSWSHSKWEKHATHLLELFLNAGKMFGQSLYEFKMICECKISELDRMEANLTYGSDVPWSKRQILRGLLVLWRVDRRGLVKLEPMFVPSPMAIFYKILGMEGTEGTLTIPKLKDTLRDYLTLKLEMMLDQKCNRNYEQALEDLLQCLGAKRPLYSAELKVTVPQGMFVFLLFKKTIFKHCIIKENLYSSLTQIALATKPDLWAKYFKEFMKHVLTTAQLRNDPVIQEEFLHSAEMLWVYCMGNNVGENIAGEIRCLDLIYDLRLIVGPISSKVMLKTVAEFLKKKQSSDVQRMHFLTQVVRAFGMIAPSGLSPMVAECICELKVRNIESLMGESKRVQRTLLIRTLFDAANYTFCLEFFLSALDWYIVLDNDFEVDAAFCREFVMKLSTELQSVLLSQVFAMGEMYTFKQRIVLALCLCNLLAYCQYEQFEAFYVKYIEEILEDFGKDSIESKTLSCILLNRLFGNIKIENFETQSCPITTAACYLVNTGMELVKKVAAILLNVCKEDGHGQEPEHFRLYQCYAYNALTTLICNALKGKIDYGKLFVRIDANSQQDILWCKLVPLDKPFNFEILTDDIPRKRKVLSDIRTEITAEVEPQAYIESQNLFLSTLKEDITNYDFTNVAVRHGAGASEIAAMRQDAMAVEIYDEDINKHECMLAICGVIKHMHESDMLKAKAPPPWINSIASMLLDDTTFLNIRQFLCKIIENSQEYLKQYSHILTAGVIKTICRTCNDLNSLAIDCVVMLVTTWKEHTPAPADIAMLIQYLMKNLWNERNDVLKYNVDLLKTTVETYKPFTLEDGFVESLFPQSSECKSNMAVVHIINVLLVNGISPFPRRIKTFAGKLNKLLTSPDPYIYKAVAETVGLTLRFLEETGHSSFEKYKATVDKLVKSLHTGKAERDAFVRILDGIVKNYPEFGGSLLKWIVMLIGLDITSDSAKVTYLQVYLKSISNVCVMDDIEHLPLIEWLSSASLEMIVVTMEIILKVVDDFKEYNAATILKVILNLSNTSAVCRIVRIDILIAFYKRFCDTEHDNLRDIMKQVKRHLISGLVDVEAEIRTKVYQFWTEHETMPHGLEEKLLYLLEELYDDASEEVYLTISNNLMLHALVDNGEPLFSAPLHQCEFKNYEVSSYWRAQNASLLPMFTSSLSQSQSQGMQLRATQDYEFEQTVLATQRRTFTQSPSQLTYGDTLQNASVFKDPNDHHVTPVHKIKKWRFFKNKADVSKMHAIREMHKSEEIAKQRHEAKKKREGQVKIYRRYRTGDFPDIQIGIGAIADTLKELSRHDGDVAQLLYKALFDSIVDASARVDFLDRGNEAIQKIFTASTTFDPVCLGVLLHIGLEHTRSLRFPPELIKTVATKSGNLAVGCLLLEEYLISGRTGKNEKEEEEVPAKRGVAASVSNETGQWVHLAGMYRKMEEWDVVLGIFADRMACPDEALLAIKEESESYWSSARKSYLKLIEDDYDVNRKDFYYGAYFKCAEEVSDWAAIERHCIETTQGSRETIFKELWSSEWNMEILLPYYIKSRVRVGDKLEFEKSVRQALQDAAKKEHLRNEFSDELALLYLENMKIKLAGNYAENHAKGFLKKWIFTKPLYTSVQNKILLEMKNCVEISVLLDLYNQITTESYMDVISTFTDLWTKSSALDSSIPTAHLTTRIQMRKAFVNLTKLKLQSLELEEDEEQGMLHKLSQFAFDAEVNLTLKALQQKNLLLAQHYGKQVVARNDFNHPAKPLLFSKVAFWKAQLHATADPAKLLCQGIKGHHDCVSHPKLKDHPALAVEAALHLTELCKAIVRHAESNDETMDLSSYAAFVQGSVNCYDDLLIYGFENLRSTLERLDKSEWNGEQLADAFFTLANEYAARGGGCESRFIECSLKSMEYGSEKARLMFPKLLDVDCLLTTHKAQFIQQTSKIPIYMFISWIPQLLAYCNSDKVTLVRHIAIKLAMEYPNSIIYPYKLSKEKFTLQHPETRNLISVLDKLLCNELVDKMLGALKYVAVTSTIIQTALAKLKNASNESEATFRQVGAQVATLFDPEMDDSLRGDYYSHVLKYRDKIMSVIRSPFDREAIQKQLAELVITKVRDSLDLGRYSPWLNYFHASDHEKEIEVPGCYTGHGRPLPYYHPKIAKFSTDVTVLQSQRSPIRITIYANDCKEYRFLVKYGEDLRLDQRIQQLFKQMNVVLSSDVKCRERKLHVSTFEVIPLTGDLGFIQWVDETDTLRNVIKNRCGIRSIEMQMNRAYGEYATWVQKAGRGSDIYAQAAVKYTKEETSMQYQKVVNMLSWDALRKSLWNISPDPETFFALRMTFIRSYAVMCIANWLVGIGDRHLENILVNMDTGGVVGIDFGHAFGSATQAQRVPELVPFRLTPQIVNVMHPLKESGLLHQTMTHALRVLRANSDALLSTMNIFIVEPTLSWSWMKDDAWNTAIIMQLARAKFEGRNPIRIMIKEVNSRTKDSEEVKRAYVECLDSVLRLCEDDVLSVHDQVKCLIAHATDANCLGRMFAGWAPWI